MDLSLVVFDIFDFLEIRIRGHWRSSKLVPFNRLFMVIETQTVIQWPWNPG